MNNSIQYLLHNSDFTNIPYGTKIFLATTTPTALLMSFYGLWDLQQYYQYDLANFWLVHRPFSPVDLAGIDTEIQMLEEQIWDKEKAIKELDKRIYVPTGKSDEIDIYPYTDEQKVIIKEKMELETKRTECYDKKVAMSMEYNGNAKNSYQIKLNKRFLLTTGISCVVFASCILFADVQVYKAYTVTKQPIEDMIVNYKHSTGEIDISTPKD